jgi:hypothetical protein
MALVEAAAVGVRKSHNKGYTHNRNHYEDLEKTASGTGLLLLGEVAGLPLGRCSCHT